MISLRKMCQLILTISGKDLKGRELGKGISQRADGRFIARFTSKTGKRFMISS